MSTRQSAGPTRKPSGARPAGGAAERPQLGAKPRTITGTRAVRRLRREGFVPGVLYGKSVTASAVVVSRQELVRFLHARAGEHGLLTLRVDADPADGGAGGKVVEKPVLIKRVEHDPVSGHITHVDFQAIVLTEQIRIKVPLVLKGDPVGVKQDGGVLEHFLREVEVECLPTAIPKQIEHDVGAMKIGDTLHVRDLTAPAGTRITTDPESGIASVLMPKEEKPAEAEAVTEPEVIREKKPEAEEADAEGKEEKKAERPEKKEEKKEKKEEK